LYLSAHKTRFFFYFALNFLGDKRKEKRKNILGGKGFSPGITGSAGTAIAK
jgi:hypothetical protein